MPQPTGCEALRFEAGLQLKPQHGRPDEPAGFDIDLKVKQNDDPDGLSSPTVRKVQVRLPEGVAISPPSAWGLDGCSDAATKLGTAEAAVCPETSKIGSVAIDTPLLPNPLVGDVFLRSPQPGNLFRLLIEARGSGIVIKLPGTVLRDPQTGQITAIFDNNPQLPFSNLRMSLRGGDRAPLVNPATCGPKTTTTEITAHTGAVVSSSSTFNIEGCGPDVFAPSFSAGVQNAVAGKSGAFSLTLRRAGGPQVLRTLRVEMPKGLLARVGDVPLCDDSAAANGACGEQSRVGSVTVGAGAGASPYHLGGRVYMGGPYKGAPYSLSIVVPAIAGPFDLGTVVVRAAVAIDRNDTSLTIASDPMPTILEGVPLNLRTLNVTMDRDQFMVNPTNCSRASVDGVIGSQTGTEVARSARFQVADCAALPFKPKLTLTAGNARRSPRNGLTMPLTATLKMTPGQANNRLVRVDLPRTVNARLEVINNDKACTMEQFIADRCPQSIGSATAVTPLLQEPLTGPIYLVRNPARRLPDMVVRLRGQGTASLVAVDVTGKITINRNLTLRTAFDTIPDVPITSFKLSLVAGKRGAVGAIGNFCTARVRKASVARLAFRAQSGKRVNVNQRMKVAGCKSARQSAKAKRGRGAKRAAKKRGAARSAR
ncbi:hypothetical protein [Conexibacter arvalis]|uniref:Uncharacterized protein n=1 Tax=Conexibacter arvalis TaxID=912552 RepID=A0A840ICG3_9ACTN|nr:hypothetical protein [Conexibacter arvalis]MBB4662627.1 hypothetical protein [Conexibacter arvalis]